MSPSMTVEFKLPDLGEGVHEGQIIKLHAREGDSIREDQPLMEVETDKAAVEIPSPYTGTVLQVHVSEKQLVHVGDVMYSFETGEGAGAATAAPTTAAAPAAPVPAPAPAKPPPAPWPITRRKIPAPPTGYGHAPATTAHRARRAPPTNRRVPPARRPLRCGWDAPRTTARPTRRP